jgi:DNA-binding transcriptional MocR family regulator
MTDDRPAPTLAANGAPVRPKHDSAVVRVATDLRRMAVSAAPGTRLPSIRKLASQYGASPVTVQQAVTRLVRAGVVDARPGDGTFVAVRPVATRADDYGWQAVPLGSGLAVANALDQLVNLPRPDTISLSSGFLDASLQPRNLLGSAMARAARRPGAWGRVPLEGLDELRGFFAAEVGGGLSADNVLVTPGGQAPLSSSFRGLAVPGDPVLMESPTYVGAIAAARAAGLRVVPVPADAEGIRPDLLAAAFEATGARLCYCQPRYTNPTGALMSIARRADVMRVVSDVGAFVIEDDWVRDLDLEGTSPSPLAADDPDGHVVHVRSLTKPVAPGLRVGALIARGPAFARLRARRSVDDFFVAATLQETALEVAGSPAWLRHLHMVRTELRARRDALVSAVGRYWPTAVIPLIPRGGLHLWVELPQGVSDVQFAQDAALAGVALNAGSDWFPADPTGSFLRLSYGGAHVADLTAAVAHLAMLLPAEAPSTDESARRTFANRR